MKNIWIPGLLIFIVLISGCTYYSPTPPSKEAVEPVHTAPSVVTTTSLPMTATVEIDDFLFFPAEVVIGRGGTVTWKQKQFEEHTVTGAGFESGNLARGKMFSHTFNEVGTYEYRCKLHPSMKAKIIVK